jgi:hypothetical protein
MPSTTPWSSLSRRELLSRYAGGLGGIALLSLLAEEGLLAGDTASSEPLHVPRGERRHDLTPKPPHFAPQAKAVISLFQHGGPSHLDLFDPKPELEKWGGKDYPGEVTYSFVNRASRKLLASPFRFERHGACGTPFSELVPHTASIADDIAVVRSMYTGINGHEPSIWSMQTGLPRPGRPSLGSWITYGLGSESQDLPAYVVLTDPGGLPVDGVRNWSQGWMPSVYQGTPIRPTEPRIPHLDAPPELRGATQRRQLALLDRLNRSHAARLGGDDALEARIASFELAARMQTAAREALDLSSESEATRKLYGLDEDASRSYGERLLLARRLVERGVRYVLVLINGQIWDNHENIRDNLRSCCARTDKPSAGLVKDLKSRGLLDSTLVVWTGEFGRTPFREGRTAMGKTLGRDHHPYCYSMFLAGGGVKPGITHGGSDELGFYAVENKTHVHDLQATLLHLLGFDHERLTYKFQGRDFRLTDVHGKVVREILA